MKSPENRRFYTCAHTCINCEKLAEKSADFFGILVTNFWKIKNKNQWFPSSILWKNMHFFKKFEKIFSGGGHAKKCAFCVNFVCTKILKSIHNVFTTSLKPPETRVCDMDNKLCANDVHCAHKNFASSIFGQKFLCAFRKNSVNLCRISVFF